MMRYWVKGKASSGNWYDLLGTNSLKNAEDHARYHRDTFNEDAAVFVREEQILGTYPATKKDK